VVGWVDLQGADVEKRLEYFSQYPVIKGWRHIAQAEPDNFLLGEPFQRGISALGGMGYTYDVLIYHHQLKPALEMIKRFPNQQFVIDHCAKPNIRRKDIKEWAAVMKDLAKLDHVYCKLSGLLTEAEWKSWKPADFYPGPSLFDAFGTDRLMRQRLASHSSSGIMCSGRA
jgi:L-fuconolactonase